MKLSGINVGQTLKIKMRTWGSLTRMMERALLNNDQDKINWVKGEMDSFRSSFDLYMKDLPQKFDKNYGPTEYRKDKHNVLEYYSIWNRENVYQAKESLKRCKRYEKREGLSHFLDIMKQKLEMDKLEKYQGGY